MRLIYLIAYIVFFFVILAVAFLASKTQSKFKKYLMKMLFTGVIIVLLCGMGVLFKNELLSLLFLGLFSVGVNWCLLFVLEFIEKYTSIFKSVKLSRVITMAVCGLDSISLALNPFLHHVYDVKKVNFGNGEFIHYIGQTSWGYYLHLGVSYTLATFIVLALVDKSISSPSIYKKKYTNILVMFLLALALDAVCYTYEKYAGFAVIGYAMLATAIFYYSVYYVPKRLSGDLLANTIKNLQNGLMVFDYDSECIYANDYALDYIGAKRDQLMKATIQIKSWLNNREPADVDNVEWTESKSAGKGKIKHMEIQFRKILDTKNKYIGFYFVIVDRTNAVDEFANEKYKGTHDQLTGLYNKQGFYEKVEEIIKAEPDVPRYIICSDIRNFKMINDIFGMEKGDAILKRIANSMSQHCIGNDSIPAHLNADKFAICMRKERFNEKLFIDLPAQVVQLNDESGYRVMNILGIYEIDDVTVPVSTMVDRAYLAMETIKNDYSKMMVFYSNEHREMVIRDQNIVSELRPAIKSGQFKIYIQPQVYASDREVRGGEALVRWIHPTRGMISPGEFIPVFEKTGLISVLDKYVWELACEQLRKWKSIGFSDFYISVNISPRDFYYTDIYETFTGLVEKYGISPRNLKLEITETAVMSNFEKQLEVMDRLRAYGFIVELDDFGSGYSSLNMLKDMKIDVLKVDMGFLTRNSDVEKSHRIINMIIEMAQSLGMEAITEGVETEEQVQFLTESGCDLFQGYYFSRPIPVEEFEEKYLGFDNNY